MEGKQARCETCRFWHIIPDEESCIGPSELKTDAEMYADRVDADGYVPAGECRRYPPVGFCGAFARDSSWTENARGVWPYTLPLDWCGEWQRREA